MASTVNGIPVPDDTDVVAQGAANMRAIAGKLQCVAAGNATAVLTNVTAANVAISFPVGRFANPPYVGLATTASSTYYAYTVSKTNVGATVGARHYKDVVATVNVGIDWVAAGT